MLEIKPIQTKAEQKDFCDECGIPYRVEAMAYSAKDNGEFIGMSQFRIVGNCGEIYDLSNKTGISDIEALIITGKATLNFIDMCGVKFAKIYTEENNLPTLLEFKKNASNEWTLDLEGYFNSPCQRKL